MILTFSTQINGKETFFVEKIWEAILRKGILCNAVEMCQIATKALPENYLVGTHKPKLHTIREDKNDRWKVGVKIDFYINCRQKDMFRFAPVLPVVSVQKIEIIWFHCSGKKTVRVFIDEKSFACVIFEKELIVTGKMLQLAQNDGFDTIEDFFTYFNKDFKGKIIHWTDLRY